MDSITVRRRWRASNKMVAFIGGHDEESVLLGNSIFCETGEEFVEGIIIGCECGNVAGFTGAISRSRRMLVVGVRNISERNGHTMLLHRSEERRVGKECRSRVWTY